VTLSASLQLPFRPLGESGLSFLLFIPASGVAALYGGLGPGLLATTLSAILVTVLPLGPQGWSRAHVPPGAGLGLFLVSCLIIVLATEGLHRAQTRALAAEAESREAAERSRGEAALRATVEELTRTNRELEQFAYVASHDLQEPLRMVRAYAGLLADRYGTALDDKGCQYLAFVREGAGRMTLLIEDLLQYSRLGSRLSRQSSVDLAACASEAVRSLAGMIQENDARILLDPLPPVKGDPTLLTQVFLNLLSNALKFRSDRRPEIRLGCRDIAGEKAVFVQDNGIGLDPGNAARIFEIFQRLHPRERYPGTGIGLCICRKIVESHGGRIWVESAPGEGSTFLFTLPGAPVAP
jgi:light-regulated signal transduction histidine kinase (bacteriophytochrome)